VANVHQIVVFHRRCLIIFLIVIVARQEDILVNQVADGNLLTIDDVSNEIVSHELIVGDDCVRSL
jgi:hypothetical protein